MGKRFGYTTRCVALRYFSEKTEDVIVAGRHIFTRTTNLETHSRLTSSAIKANVRNDAAKLKTRSSERRSTAERCVKKSW